MINNYPNTIDQHVPTRTRATIAARVAADAETLRNAPYTTLLDWATEHGIDNRSAWGRYKRALSDIGVNFDRMRDEHRAAARNELVQRATRTLILYCDARASTERFAICDENGEPVWYGRFFDMDRDFNGEQSSGELAAAKKAVWLAAQVAERTGESVALTLRVDAEWLTWANATDGSGGKAKALAAAAQRLGVALHVEHIPGTSNPADAPTVGRGYMRWQDGIERLLEGTLAHAS
jgi:hypothetical protein